MPPVLGAIDRNSTRSPRHERKRQQQLERAGRGVRGRTIVRGRGLQRGILSVSFASKPRVYCSLMNSPPIVRVDQGIARAAALD